MVEGDGGRRATSGAASSASRPPTSSPTTASSIPGHGVYAAFANGVPAAVNVGIRPTFETGRGVLIETYLIDCDEDLYGKTLRVAFVERLRGERRFPSVEELIAQMHRDVEDARRVCAGFIDWAEASIGTSGVGFWEMPRALDRAGRGRRSLGVEAGSRVSGPRGRSGWNLAEEPGRACARGEPAARRRTVGRRGVGTSRRGRRVPRFCGCKAQTLTGRSPPAREHAVVGGVRDPGLPDDRAPGTTRSPRHRRRRNHRPRHLRSTTPRPSPFEAKPSAARCRHRSVRP